MHARLEVVKVEWELGNMILEFRRQVRSERGEKRRLNHPESLEREEMSEKTKNITSFRNGRRKKSWKKIKALGEMEEGSRK